MNTLRTLCGALLPVALAATACRSGEPVMNGDRDQQQHFGTLEEAVAKARQDFLGVLRADRGFNLGVDAATLERSVPGQPVRRVDVAFDRLLNATPTDSLGALVDSERNMVVPLVTDGRVSTIVEVVRAERGWRVVGLAGSDIAGELDTVRRASPEAAAGTMTLYEIPNLQARVYGVRTAEVELFFTDHGDFTLRQPVRAEALIPVLRADAIEFQRQFGDTLRQQQLLRGGGS